MARAANALNVLLNQLNNRAPGRNKASDGWIGDADHQNRNSDHNPWYPPPGGGIVTARDFTHDPGGGLDCQWLADTLVTNRDPRIKYIIWNRRIWTPGVGWRAYTGSNAHTHHLHLSVVASPANDTATPWAGITAQRQPEVDMQADERNMLVAIYEGLYKGGPSTHSEPLAETLWQTKGAALRAEAKTDALAGTVSNNQAAVMAAIADNGVEVDLTTEQMQQLLAGMTSASKQGMRELLGSLDNPTGGQG